MKRILSSVWFWFVAAAVAAAVGIATALDLTRIVPAMGWAFVSPALAFAAAGWLTWVVESRATL